MYLSVRFGRWSRIVKMGLAIAFVLTFGRGSASADSNLQLGPTSPGPYSGPYLYQNQHVIGLGSPGTVYVWQNQASADSLLLPSKSGSSDGFLLLLGIPNDTTNSGKGGGAFASNPITPTTVGGPAGGPYFGGSWDATTGFAGLMTSTSGPQGKNPTGGDGEAYTTANLSGANNSNSFTNWSGAESSITGITATNFGIYVFQINANLTGKNNAPPGTDPVGVKFTTLPQGTFIIAYGEDSGSTVYDTAFTQPGIANGPPLPVINAAATPAPPSIVLLGLGGLVSGILLLRSRRRLVAA